jgi:very-short-patch-repair endonuclease
MREIPQALRSAPFTVEEAEKHGVTQSMLRGKRFARVSAGLYRVAGHSLALHESVGAALKLLPADAAVSHTTNLALRGIAMGDAGVLHFATETPARVRRAGLRLHRYRWPIEVEGVAGFPLLKPERTFVDCATLLTHQELLAVGDWMVAHRLTTVAKMVDYVVRSHLDGVLKAREVAPFIRRGTESVQESVLRWQLIDGGLPEPEINGNVFDDEGTFIARCDLLYRPQRVAIEYDGWYHERSSAQRQYDLRRRERLEAAGWTVVIVTAADLQNPRKVVQRISEACARSRFGHGWLLS